MTSTSELWTGGRVTPRAACVLGPNPGVMTLDGTNTWVLREPGAGEVVVVDPGPLDEAHLAEILRVAGEDGGSVALVLLTHHHHDHTESAERFAALTGAPVRGAGRGAPLRDGERIAVGQLDARGGRHARPHRRLGEPAGAGGPAAAQRRHRPRPRHDGDRLAGRRPRQLPRHARAARGPRRRRPGRAHRARSRSRRLRPRRRHRRVPRASAGASRPAARGAGRRRSHRRRPRRRDLWRARGLSGHRRACTRCRRSWPTWAWSCPGRSGGPVRSRGHATVGPSRC